MSRGGNGIVEMGITRFEYNFREDIGVLASDGQPAFNLITQTEKLRAREFFQILSDLIGVQFVETERDGLIVASSDREAINLNQPLFVVSLNRNDRYNWGSNEPIGTGGENSGWFRSMANHIGTYLGLGETWELPGAALLGFDQDLHDVDNNGTLDNPIEPVVLNDNDLAHLRYLYYPESKDIDLFRFTLQASGRLTAETFAERQLQSSELDTALTLWRENSDGTRELLSRNDNYFSRDSYLEIDLEPGVYYVGVSASGNDEYDPIIEDSGFGGTSQGRYDLRLNFRDNAYQAIFDADNPNETPTYLDGDGDGVPGGVYNFWFQTRPTDRIIRMTGDGRQFVDGQTLTLEDAQRRIKTFEFDNNNSRKNPSAVAVSFNALTTPAEMANRLVNAINAQSGINFGIAATLNADGTSLKITGDRSVKTTAETAGVQLVGQTLFVDKTPGTNLDGSLQHPFDLIPEALSASVPGDIVRILGNAGLDTNPATLNDNRAYQIGFDTLGGTLRDGSTLEVPRGLTVMVDAGAIFQFRRARISVGSSAINVDRSGGAFQVLGTPYLLADSNGNNSIDTQDTILLAAGTGKPAPGSVYFTSYHDQATGLDTNPFVTTPKAGDWGGIVFQQDIDRSEARFVYEQEGIFLNYVNHADIRYGGGGVVVHSVVTVIDAIHITDARPTLTYNTLSWNADAAMSASPDSFEETNFHAPRYQRVPYTSDYVRIGPDIRHNTLGNNSINGLFVRTRTEAGSVAQELTVSGRWDDNDIVHVLTENLAISSQPGGAMERVTPPPTALVVAKPASGGTLATATYQYKLTYVDRFGYEGPASVAIPVTVSGANGTVKLTQLPPAPEGFAGRRLYRSKIDGLNVGLFELVTQMDRITTGYVDTGTARGGVLDVPPVALADVGAAGYGALPEGTYRYRITYVDSVGHESRPSDLIDSPISISGNPTASGEVGNGTIELTNLPVSVLGRGYVGRRIYRSDDLGNGFGPYLLVAELADNVPGLAPDTTFVDDGIYDPAENLRFRPIDPEQLLEDAVAMPRLDGRLAIDPSVVVKLEGSRIEVELGAQLIAEASDGREIIFTSLADDRYGAGGTFDTGADGPMVVGTSTAPQAGDWGGIYAGPLSSLNVDHGVFAFGGGVTRVEGTLTAFNTVEIHEQSLARVAGSVFEFNARGQGGQGEVDRIGRGFNEPGVIFVRQAQPVIYGNTFRNNPVAGLQIDPGANPDTLIPAVSINVNALNDVLKRDTGRTTGTVERLEGYRDNRGPLIVGNRLQNNQLNGMVVRGETVSTHSIWDDTDIVHIVLDTVYVPDFHTNTGLTLTSNATESLVVKLLNNPTTGRNAGLVALGIPHEIDDRIGGIIQVVGQPSSPVVITSLRDDSRAGLQPNGDPQTDTNNDGVVTAPAPGDWNSVRLDVSSHDRNVELVYEWESRDAQPPGTNGDPSYAQALGLLAPAEYSGDENRRLGFTVEGFLSAPTDSDIYSFQGLPQTELWIDLDRTTQAFDPVIELLDADGNVLAVSDNSYDERRALGNYLEPDSRNAGVLPQEQLEHPWLMQFDYYRAASILGEDGINDNLGRPMEKTLQVPVRDFYTWNDAGAPLAATVNVPKEAALEVPVRDLYSVNPRDAGMRLILPENPDPNNADRPRTYHIRVRGQGPSVRSDIARPLGFTSDTITLAGGSWLDAGFAKGQKIVVEGSMYNDGVYTVADVPNAGTLKLVEKTLSSETVFEGATVSAPLTAGAYQMQLRLREVDEIAGSTVATPPLRMPPTASRSWASPPIRRWPGKLRKTVLRTTPSPTLSPWAIC